MEGQAGERRLFPCADYDHSRHFYAYGNTPPEDFLQSVSVADSREPTVLSLGCGDMRSPMFTILNNFGFKGKNNGFTGVKFVLNDRSASVLARNILFLYLCTTMPESIDKRKEWIASVWSLWYNHELQPQHKQMLEAATQQLLSWSSTWNIWSHCPLSKFMQFSSPATFAKVKATWSNWKTYSEKCVPKMKSEREEFQMFHLLAMGIPPGSSREKGLRIRANEDVKINLAIHSFDTSLNEKIVDEYVEYLSHGTEWAEIVLGIPMSNGDTAVNPTLFEQDNYNLHYSLTPYKGFSSSFLYTPAGVEKTFGSLMRLLPVADHQFQSRPMLANAVQQFSMWLQATANMLKSNKVSFTFDIGDSIEFSYFLLHNPNKYSLFDAIYTSNLFDYIWPPQLVFSTIPLLKPSGTLFTATLKTFVSMNNTFLETHFGFPPELFPVFLGVHCIGQDGKYSSAINHRPCPNSLLPEAHCTIFPWREIESQLLVINNIGESKIAVDCLSKLFSYVCHSNNPVEDFLCVLQQFLKRVQSPILSSTFLNALAIAIKKDTSVECYLVQLQTQSFLRDLHMHITVTEDNCPVCNHQPPENYVQQLSLSVNMSQRNAESFILKLLDSIPRVTLTSFAVKVASSKLELTFYLPKFYCSSQNGTLTVETTVAEKKGLILGIETIIPEKKTIFEGTIKSLKASATNYMFYPLGISKVCTQELPLGCIVKHVDTGCSFETIILMNDTCLKTLKTKSNMQHSTGSKNLNLRCGSLTTRILYPYAVKTAKVSVENSQILVKVDRDCSIFYKERSTYYVNPGNQLSLPRFEFDIDTMRKYCYLQALYSVPGYPVSFINLFTYLVNKKQRCLISGKISRRYTYVYIHNLHFSPIFGSPALEVSCCFLDEKPQYLRSELDIQLGGKLKSEFDVNEVDDDEYNLMKEILKFFSAITKCKISTTEHSNTIFLNAQEHFDHAVLFPLYPNHANPTFKKQQKFVNSVPALFDVKKWGEGREDVCSFCKDLEIQIKCDHCKKAKYCSDECKEMHWEYHRNSCKDVENKGSAEKATKPNSHMCSNCEKSKDSLKCCSKCKNAWYCNEKCQRLHFPQHRETCAAQK